MSAAGSLEQRDGSTDVTPMNGGAPPYRRRLPSRWLELAAAAGIAGGAAAVFSPGLRAGFVSDAFAFLESASAQSLGGIMAAFVPNPRHWYRPMTELVFWLEARAFGADPLGYHLVALACHLLSAFLLGAIAARLAGSRVAGPVTALFFAFSIHAQEVVFDIADLHNALGGVALTATVLAYLRNARAAAVFFAAVALTIDEAGTLALALVVLHAVLDRREGGAPGRRVLLNVARTAWPFALLVAGYAGWRLLASHGAVYNETVPCRTPRCLWDGAVDYFNRLLLRPDALRWQGLAHRGELAFRSAMAVAGILGLWQAWRWRRRRAVAFAVGWAAGAAAFHILALYPYVADRFVYVADMGVALLFGIAAAEVRGQWKANRPVERAGAVAACAVLAVWLALAVPMLSERGRLYVRAGERAEAILTAIAAAVADPPPGATLVLRGVPVIHAPQIAPGNTGPFLFNNGLESAVRLRLGRSDLKVLDEARSGRGAPHGAILLEVRDASVVVVGRG